MVMTWQSKNWIMYVYLRETKAVHSSAFPALFYLTLALSTILIQSTTWIWWRPGSLGTRPETRDRACMDSKHVFVSTSLLLPRIVKAGRGPGNEATHPLDLWTASHETVPFDRWVKYGVLLARILLRGLDDVSQLLHEVAHLLYEAGQLLYEVDQLLCEVGQQIFADSHQGMWQAGDKSSPSV